MANITRIKASDTRKRHDLDDATEAEVVTRVKATPKNKAEAGTAAKSKKQVAEKSAPQEATEQTSQKASVAKNNDKKASDSKKAGKKHKTPKFIRVITKPFRALGRYLRDSWGELRQVRWPSRKATWKLTLAVIVYCGVLIAIIMGLDLVFTELFGWILS